MATRFLHLAAGAVLLLGVTSAATAQRESKPPTIARHANLRVEATGLQGAIVSYRPAITRNATSVKYSKRSGTVFPLGTTTVTIVAKNKLGTARSSFKVVVVDTTPPAFGTLVDLTVQANSGSGATPTFSPTATDLVDPNVVITCTPASGSLFAVGTTTVTCTARDASGNTATRTFRVTVKPALAPGVVPNAHYSGTTAQGKPITFSVTGDGLHITGMTIPYDLGCTQNASAHGTYTHSGTTISPIGVFDISTGQLPETQTGYTGWWSMVVHGQFSGTGQVSGTFQHHWSLSSPGPYECDSGVVSWSATLGV